MGRAFSFTSPAPVPIACVWPGQRVKGVVQALRLPAVRRRVGGSPGCWFVLGSPRQTCDCWASGGGVGFGFYSERWTSWQGFTGPR